MQLKLCTTLNTKSMRTAVNSQHVILIINIEHSHFSTKLYVIICLAMCLGKIFGLHLSWTLESLFEVYSVFTCSFQSSIVQNSKSYCVQVFCSLI